MRYKISRQINAGKLTSLILITLTCTLSFVPSAGADEADAFLPTWRLLSAEQKQQFISGYLFGWRDAAKISQIAVQFVRDNPDKGLESLEKISSLYEFSEARPASVAAAVDAFFADPKNSNATLSMAVSSAQSIISGGH